MNNNSIAVLDNISKLYSRGSEEVHAVERVTLEIEKSDYVTITGPSGSGKTTLMNIIGCIDNPTSGKVFIEGIDVSTASQEVLTEIRRNKLGFVFQQFFLIPTLTAVENVQLPGLFSSNKERVKKAEELLDMVELGHRKNHLPGQLSGGEMQRVAIARALINSPDILLADEPTGNLDSVNSENIYKIFDSMNKKGLAIIVVTHNMELAKHSKRIIALKDGKIISH